MPRKKTELQKSLGQLISVIQKEWGEQLGETQAANLTEDVMDLAHKLLQASTPDRVNDLLGSLSIKQYLGEVWVQAHPNVKPVIADIAELLKEGGN